jgi:hypothetical protein
MAGYKYANLFCYTPTYTPKYFASIKRRQCSWSDTNNLLLQLTTTTRRRTLCADAHDRIKKIYILCSRSQHGLCGRVQRSLQKRRTQSLRFVQVYTRVVDEISYREISRNKRTLKRNFAEFRNILNFVS